MFSRVVISLIAQTIYMIGGMRFSFCFRGGYCMVIISNPAIASLDGVVFIFQYNITFLESCFLLYSKRQTSIPSSTLLLLQWSGRYWCCDQMLIPESDVDAGIIYQYRNHVPVPESFTNTRIMRRCRNHKTVKTELLSLLLKTKVS